MKPIQHTQHDTTLAGWWNPANQLPPFGVEVECVAMSKFDNSTTYRELASLTSILSKEDGDFPQFDNDDGYVVVLLWRYIEQPPRGLLDEAIEDYKQKYK